MADMFARNIDPVFEEGLHARVQTPELLERTSLGRVEKTIVSSSRSQGRS